MPEIPSFVVWFVLMFYSNNYCLLKPRGRKAGYIKGTAHVHSYTPTYTLSFKIKVGPFAKV